jgi:hypothetical protein
VWTTLAVLSVFFLAVSALLGEELLKVHHTAVMFLPALLTVFCLTAMAKKKGIIIAISTVMLFFYTVTLYETYGHMAKYGDEKRVASYIMKSEKSGEPILIFRAEFVLPFTIHYTGKNRVVPIPGYPKLERYDLHSQALRTESELIHSVSPILSHARRCWLITRHTESFRGVDFHPEVLEDFVSKYYTVVDRKNFYKSQVRLLEKKEGISFDWEKEK